MPTKISITSSQVAKSNRSFTFQRHLGHLDRVRLPRGGNLVGSSLPIEAALAAVAEQADKQHVKGLIMAIRSKVLEGYSLAVSLGDHTGSFNSLYRATVSAGEQSGFSTRCWRI